MKQLLLLWQILLVPIIAITQNPYKNVHDAMEIRYSSTQPIIHYILKIDTNKLTSFSVEMQIQNIVDTFKLAMVAHPEYDDKYWRFVRDLSIVGKNGPGKMQRRDSALWLVTISGKQATIKYRIDLPPSPAFRAAWRPFLNAQGVLFGGPHSFMYVLGQTPSPVSVTVQLPSTWKISTGLVPTLDANTFFAPTIFALTDAPILAGNMKSWTFFVDGVPHSVDYFSTHLTAFNEKTLVSNIEKIVRQAALVFGRLPYREYHFQLEDSSYGALEHNNSVTLGAPSSQLATDMSETMEELAHEYFHSWNLVRIHPKEYGDIDYRKPELSKGLWFSEGITMFYADLLLRRAGIAVEDSTRIIHLERILGRYYSNRGNTEVSPEKISMAAYGPPGMTGDYLGSSHVQGEVLGTVFDLAIRDATGNKKSMDDVMRLMMEKFSAARGFDGKDVEHVLKQVSGKDFHQFFDDHVRGNKKIDFNEYLPLIGMKMKINWIDETDDKGHAVPNLRVYVFRKENESFLRLGITDPSSIWAKAGLHTGDEIKSVNDTAINNRDDFWKMLRHLQIGDSVTVKVRKRSEMENVIVHIQGFKKAKVIIEEMPQISQRQKMLREAFLGAKVKE